MKNRKIVIEFHVKPFYGEEVRQYLIALRESKAGLSAQGYQVSQKGNGGFRFFIEQSCQVFGSQRSKDGADFLDLLAVLENKLSFLQIDVLKDVN